MRTVPADERVLPVRLLPSLVTRAAAVVVALALTSPTAAHADFTGIDGVTYASGPDVVTGLGDELFYGPDFDVACGLGGEFVRSMERFAKVAKVIRRSGRTVVWSMGLNKSLVLPGLLDPAAFPHGRCDTRGLTQQRKAVLAYGDPSYLDLVAPLVASPRQVWFKTDTHWNTVAAAVYARALARRLDPRLARLQKFRYGTESRVGGLNFVRGIDTPEISPTATPRGPVKVRTARGTPAWPGYPALTYDHSWTTRPAARTWPGRTLVLGDSYMMFALENLRPLFRHGRWLWMAYTDESTMIAEIERADTVVLESYQNFLLFSELGRPGFLKPLRRALL